MFRSKGKRGRREGKFFKITLAPRSLTKIFADFLVISRRFSESSGREAMMELFCLAARGDTVVD